MAYNGHCHRGDATPFILHHALGCFVVTLLAMRKRFLASED